MSSVSARISKVFQSTPSVWRETRLYFERATQREHFNPLPPYGGRLKLMAVIRMERTFQSTPSVWRETIHFATGELFPGISIHSLRMEGDRFGFCVFPGNQKFQSTPSVWRETQESSHCTVPSHHFNPLPPYGGRLRRNWKDCAISVFQSTPSVWRETDVQRLPDVIFRISIHSLRMEGDIEKAYSSYWTGNFNPLPPYGGRLNFHFSFPPIRYFNPLPPYGGRREMTFTTLVYCCISIHSLRMEGDENRQERCCGNETNFNPLPPYGGRRGVEVN